MFRSFGLKFRKWQNLSFPQPLCTFPQQKRIFSSPLYRPFSNENPKKPQVDYAKDNKLSELSQKPKEEKRDGEEEGKHDAPTEEKQESQDDWHHHPKDPEWRPYLRNLYLIQTAGVAGTLGLASAFSGLPFGFAEYFILGVPTLVGGGAFAAWARPGKTSARADFKIHWSGKLGFLMTIFGSGTLLAPFFYAFDTAGYGLMATSGIATSSLLSLIYAKRVQPEQMSLTSPAIFAGISTILAANLIGIAVPWMFSPELAEFCTSSTFAFILGANSLFTAITTIQAKEWFLEGKYDYLQLGMNNLARSALFFLQFLVEMFAYIFEFLAALSSVF